MTNGKVNIGLPKTLSCTGVLILAKDTQLYWSNIIANKSQYWIPSKKHCIDEKEESVSVLSSCAMSQCLCPQCAFKLQSSACLLGSNDHVLYVPVFVCYAKYNMSESMLCIFCAFPPRCFIQFGWFLIFELFEFILCSVKVLQLLIGRIWTTFRYVQMWML